MSPRMFEVLCDYYEGRLTRKTLDEQLSYILLAEKEDEYSADWLLCMAVLLNELDSKDIVQILSRQSSNDMRRTLLHMLGLKLASAKSCKINLFKTYGKRTDAKRLPNITSHRDAVVAASFLDAPVSVLMGGKVPAPKEEPSWYIHSEFENGEKWSFEKQTKSKYSFEADKFQLYGYEGFDIGRTVLWVRRKLVQVTYTVDQEIPLVRWDEKLKSFGNTCELNGPCIYIESTPILHTGSQRIYRMIWPQMQSRSDKETYLDHETRLLIYSRIFAPRTIEVAFWPTDADLPTVTIRYPHKRKSETIAALTETGFAISPLRRRRSSLKIRGA